MGDRFRALWDFDDLDATEARFRSLLEDVGSDEEQAEVLTQLARVEGLRGRFDEGHALVDEAERLAGASGAGRARVLLERGRLHRSAGDGGAALPLFEQALEVALAVREEFIAVDAAHMAALAAPDREAAAAWTQRGVELAEASDDPDVRYWLGPLLNNTGWAHYEAGEYEPALDAFERAFAVRERDPARPAEREIARYAVGKTLRALGRLDEAAAALEQAVAWAEQAGSPDGWFHEELAEVYAALGRRREAGEHARLALPLLMADDPELAADAKRAERLRALSEVAG